MWHLNLYKHSYLHTHWLFSCGKAIQKCPSNFLSYIYFIILSIVTDSSELLTPLQRLWMSIFPCPLHIIKCVFTFMSLNAFPQILAWSASLSFLWSQLCWKKRVHRIQWLRKWNQDTVAKTEISAGPLSIFANLVKHLTLISPFLQNTSNSSVCTIQIW